MEAKMKTTGSRIRLPNGQYTDAATGVAQKIEAVIGEILADSTHDLMPDDVAMIALSVVYGQVAFANAMRYPLTGNDDE